MNKNILGCEQVGRQGMWMKGRTGREEVERTKKRSVYYDCIQYTIRIQKKLSLNSCDVLDILNMIVVRISSVQSFSHVRLFVTP